VFAAYAEHEMTTMTGSCRLLIGCKFARELKREKRGTMMKLDHHGNGRRYQGNEGGR